MPKTRKNTLIQRLHIIGGQVNGLAALIEKGEDCRRVTEQFYAVNSGLKKTMELYFQKNLDACLKSAVRQKRKKIEFLLREIIKSK